MLKRKAFHLEPLFQYQTNIFDIFPSVLSLGSVNDFIVHKNSAIPTILDKNEKRSVRTVKLLKIALLAPLLCLTSFTINLH